MLSLLNYICSHSEQETPPEVTSAMERMRDSLSKPPVDIMTQEEFDKLSDFKKCMLTCNMPGCGKMVCTHGMLCVKHKKEII